MRLPKKASLSLRTRRNLKDHFIPSTTQLRTPFFFLILEFFPELCSCVCLVAQSCPTLCDHMGYSPAGSSAHGDSPGKNTEVSCHALLQEIFPTQGSNSGLPNCRQIIYHLSHQGSPRILKWVAYPFSRETSQLRNQTGSLALQVDSLPAELKIW